MFLRPFKQFKCQRAFCNGSPLNLRQHSDGIQALQGFSPQRVSIWEKFENPTSIVRNAMLLPVLVFRNCLTATQAHVVRASARAFEETLIIATCK